MNKKLIQEQINKLDFAGAYSQLCQEPYIFEIDHLARDFPKIKSTTMYLFLMYAISQDESAEKHLAICNYLYFMDPYILGADSMIKWHLLQALKIARSPQDQAAIKNWILDIYRDNPDCPFTEEELTEYGRSLRSE